MVRSEACGVLPRSDSLDFRRDPKTYMSNRKMNAMQLRFEIDSWTLCKSILAPPGRCDELESRDGLLRCFAVVLSHKLALSGFCSIDTKESRSLFASVSLSHVLP